MGSWMCAIVRAPLPSDSQSADAMARHSAREAHLDPVGEAFDALVRLAGAADPPLGSLLAWRFGEATGTLAIGAEPARQALTASTVQGIATVQLELEARGPAGGRCRATWSNFASSRS
jgi:hypothetical protein